MLPRVLQRLENVTARLGKHRFAVFFVRNRTEEFDYANCWAPTRTFKSPTACGTREGARERRVYAFPQASSSEPWEGLLWRRPWSGLSFKVDE